MDAQLQGIAPRPGGFSYLSALGGCLDHLGVEASPAWLAGGTGVAFIMNMSANVDVAGPIAYDMLCSNGPCRPDGPGLVPSLEANLGYTTRPVCSCPFGACTDLDGARRRAWDSVRQSLDDGFPCLGFELAWPEFFVINGYDDTGYLFLAPGKDGAPPEQMGPAPWEQLGPMGIWVYAASVRPGQAAPAEKVLADMVREVNRRMLGPGGGGMFVMGLQGYGLWETALREGTADNFGHRYNAAAWAELRALAADFLGEAQTRLPGPAASLLAEAAGHYRDVAAALHAASALHPMQDDLQGTLQSDEAADLIRQAAAAEARGFRLLARIAEALP